MGSEEINSFTGLNLSVTAKVHRGLDYQIMQRRSFSPPEVCNEINFVLFSLTVNLFTTAKFGIIATDVLYLEV